MEVTAWSWVTNLGLVFGSDISFRGFSLEYSSPIGPTFSGSIWQPRPEMWNLGKLDQVHCPIGSVLAFLQTCFFAGAVPATLRVYVAAIAAEHAPCWVFLSETFFDFLLYPWTEMAFCFMGFSVVLQRWKNLQNNPMKWNISVTYINLVPWKGNEILRVLLSPAFASIIANMSFWGTGDGWCKWHQPNNWHDSIKALDKCHTCRVFP